MQIKRYKFSLSDYIYPLLATQRGREREREEKKKKKKICSTLDAMEI